MNMAIGCINMLHCSLAVAAFVQSCEPSCSACAAEQLVVTRVACMHVPLCHRMQLEVPPPTQDEVDRDAAGGPFYVDHIIAHRVRAMLLTLVHAHMHVT